MKVVIAKVAAALNNQSYNFCLTKCKKKKKIAETTGATISEKFW